MSDYKELFEKTFDDIDCLKFELTEYKKYDITKFRNHIRFAELLATRDGDVGGMCPLYFDGAVNYFNEMPLPSETDKLAAITNYIRSLE